MENHGKSMDIPHVSSFSEEFSKTSIYFDDFLHDNTPMTWESQPAILGRPWPAH
jgi:hypothetical protein